MVFWPLSWIVTCWIVTLVSWMSTVWYLYMYVSGTYPWTTYIDPIYVQILSYVFASSNLTCFSAFNVPDVRKTWVSFCVACSTSVSHVFHVERSEHQGSASLVFGTFRLLGGAYALLHGLLLPLHPLGGISVSQKREKVQGSHRITMGGLVYLPYMDPIVTPLKCTFLYTSPMDCMGLGNPQTFRGFTGKMLPE